MALTFGSNKLIENTDMTSSFYTEAINLNNKIGFSIHSIFTESPVGSMYLAVSIDNSNWIILDGSTQSISAAGDIFYNVDVSNYSFVRMHYVFTSGTGTMNSFFTTREVA